MKQKRIFLFQWKYARVFTLIFLTALTFLISCSKSDDPSPSPATTATISSVTSPTGTTSGPKNTVITITGTNFITDLTKIQVKVNGKSCVVISATGTAITARIPAGCGTGIVELFLDGTRYAGPVFNFVYTYTLSSITDGQTGSNVYGPLASAKFDEIESVSIDQNDNIFLGQYDYPKVKKISATNIVSLVAGSGTFGYFDGNGATAQFATPEYTCPASDGNLYVGDADKVRKIDASGNVTTLYTSPASTQLFGIKAMPSGIYLGGSNVIAKISYSGVLIWAVQTKPPQPPFTDDYDLDGDTSVAKFNTYGNIEVDSTEQNIYFNNLDYSNSINGHSVWKIKKLNIAAHTITTISGAKTGVEANDGPALQATFNVIADIHFDKFGVLWIADGQNNKIRILKDGIVSTIIGSLGSGDVDGDPSVAKIIYPTGLAFDSHGSLFIGCVGNNKIKKLVID